MAQELIDKIRAAAQAKNVDPDVAVRIAQAESSLNPSAKAKTSTAAGLFQVTAPTWKEFRGRPGLQLNADENIRVGTDIIARNADFLRTKLGRDPNAAEIYAAHFFGPTGATSVLTASPDTPVGDLLGQRAIKANPQLQGKTVAEVREMLASKMGEKPAAVSRETPSAPAKGTPPEAMPDFEGVGRGQLTADLGSGYKAALALSFLGDEEDSEEKKLDEEDKQAAKMLAEYKPFNALAELEFTPSVNPLAAAQPVQVAGQVPVQMAKGGEAKRLMDYLKDLPTTPAGMGANLGYEIAKRITGRDPLREMRDQAAQAVSGHPIDTGSEPLPQGRQGIPREVLGRADGGEVARPTPQQIEKLAEKEPEVTGINKALDFIAQRLDPKRFPTSARTLLETVQGTKSPITESSFKPEELEIIRQLAAAKGGDKGAINYTDYMNLAQEMQKKGKMAASYTPSLFSMFDPVGNVQTTLGRFSYQRDPRGNLQISDTYDFNPPNPNAMQEARTGDYGAFGPYGLIRDYAGEKIPPGRGREVRINLPPVRRAEGSPEMGELAEASRPATFNPKIVRQGAAARQLAAQRDVNTLPDPRTYAAVSGFLGTPPDQQGFSVMHPDLEGIKRAGEAGFYAGTATQVAPVVGSAAKMLGKLTGSALNERLLAGQSLTPGLNTPAPINFAVKPRGGTVLYVTPPGSEHLPISKLDDLLADYRKVAARDQQAPDDVVEFIKAKAPRYFTTTYGTAVDPLRTAIRERAIDPFGRDISKIPPYLVDAAKFPQARGHLQAKQELERMYDEMTGVRATALAPEDVLGPSSRELRQGIQSKMAAEGVPAEAQNAPSVDRFTRAEFEEYPTSTTMLRRLVNNEAAMPSNVQYALRSGEVMYDISPNMDLLSPQNVVDALKQVPVDKLKSMSFPEALIEGTRALAPVRDYRSAIEMADRGAKIPPAVLQKFTQEVTPGLQGNWVQITDPIATELEGKLMKHSVGGYSAGDSYGTGYTGLPYGGKLAFDDGLVRVYSLRNKEGLPTITVEAAKKPGSDVWDVTQIRGRFNSEPTNKADVFNLLDKLEETEGLGRIKPNSYTRSATGEDVDGTTVDWGREYEMWKQGFSE